MQEKVQRTQKFLDLIETNYKLFNTYNKKKYNYFLQDITKSSLTELIKILPILISHNDQSLPGFVKSLTFPQGIRGFIPTAQTVQILQKKFRYIKAHNKNPKAMVHMFAIMGSISTVAYAKGSDFDFWICYKKDTISQEMFELYKEKLQIISDYFKKLYNIPVHFYLNEITNLRQNIFGEEDGGGFSTTIGALLKDEFFRSSIILAGKIPFWWVTPKGTDDEKYKYLIKIAKETNSYNPFFDIGNLKVSQKEEFLGAAFFQIIKSLESPFKTILKIGLLEKYIISSDDDNTLLADELKEKIHKGLLTEDILDSYIFLYKSVYQFQYEQNVPKELLDLLNESFYIKAQPQISHKSPNTPTRKVTTFKEFVKKWDWPIVKIKHIDAFDSWELAEVKQVATKIKKYIIHTYQKINSYLPSLNIESSISKDDFTLISRKIESSFSKSPGRVEKWMAFKDEVYENIIYFAPIAKDQKVETSWVIYKSVSITAEHRKNIVINQGRKLLDILVWSGVNGIYDLISTKINVRPNYYRIDSGSAYIFLKKFTQAWQNKSVKIQNRFMLKPAFIVKAFIAINFNLPNEKEIKEIAFIYKNSWGEDYIKYFYQEKDFIKIIEIFLKMFSLKYPILKNSFDLFLPEEATSNMKSIANIMSELISFFSSTEKKKLNANKYFLMIFGNIIIRTSNQGTEKISFSKSLESILININKNPKNHFVQIGGISNNQLLGPLLASQNDIFDEKGRFYLSLNKISAEIIFKLNTGHLFRFQVSLTKANELIASLLSSLYYGLKSFNPNEEFSNIFNNTKIFKLRKSMTGHFEPEEVDIFFLRNYENLSNPRMSYNIEVDNTSPKRRYTFTIKGKKFAPCSSENLVTYLKNILQQYFSGNLDSFLPIKITFKNPPLNELLEIFHQQEYFYTMLKGIGEKLFQKKLSSGFL